VTVDDAYLLESIYYPGRKLVASYPNQMASYAGQLKYGDIRALIEYMKTITDGYAGPALSEWPAGYDGTQWIDADGAVKDQAPVQ
jgi:cytochrome c oxidase subunit 2